MNFGGDHPAHGHGEISPRCVPEGASDKKNTSSWQYIAAMYSDSATFGKICVLCIQKAPQSAVGEYSRANILPPRGVFAARSPQIMHGAQILPPSDGLGPCAGVPTPPQRPANTRHLPMPATRCTHHSQRQAADELRWRPFGAWPTVWPSPEGPPTTSSRRAGR